MKLIKMKSIKYFSKYTWLRFIATRQSPRTHLKWTALRLIQTELISADFNNECNVIKFRTRISPYHLISLFCHFLLAIEAFRSHYTFNELRSDLFGWSEIETLTVKYR